MMLTGSDDVYCFSPYFVGSLAQFQRLARVADLEGLRVCRHTHGELGITATAAHHILLTLPNIVDGNQQTAHMMQDDILKEPIPIATVPVGTGLGIEIDENKLGTYHEFYQHNGSFLPFDPQLVGALLYR